MHTHFNALLNNCSRFKIGFGAYVWIKAAHWDFPKTKSLSFSEFSKHDRFLNDLWTNHRLTHCFWSITIRTKHNIQSEDGSRGVKMKCKSGSGWCSWKRWWCPSQRDLGGLNLLRENSKRKANGNNFSVREGVKESEKAIPFPPLWLISFSCFLPVCPWLFLKQWSCPPLTLAAPPLMIFTAQVLSESAQAS